jgi:hypothetical protein
MVRGVDGSSPPKGLNSSPSACRRSLLSEETSEDAVLQGIQADEGTRTLDLLHGKQTL